MHRMTAVAVAALALLLSPAACGDDPTEPEWIPDPDLWRLAIVGGDQQSDTVTHTLPDPIRAQLVQDETGAITLHTGRGVLYAQSFPEGTPVPDQLVCWDVPDAGWGRVVPVCDVTDSLGVAVGAWALGTEAAAGIYAVGYTEADGIVVAVDTVWADALPGPVASLVLAPADTVAWLGQPLALSVTAADQYGNPVTEHGATLTALTGWTVAGLSVTPTSEADGWVHATAGAGADSTRVLGLYDLSRHGWRLDAVCPTGGRSQRASDGAWLDYDSTAAFYTADPPAYTILRADSVAARFEWAGVDVRYWSDGVVDSTATTRDYATVQRVGSITFTSMTAARQPGEPVRFLGAPSNCAGGRIAVEALP